MSSILKSANEPHAPQVAIVDAYSSANALAEEFAKHGFSCVHVQTSEKTPPLFKGSEKPEFFKEVFVHRDLDTTLSHLRNMHLIAVVPGAESGVELADDLASCLDLPSNNPATIAARRDKFLMQEAVRGAGLKAIPQIKVKGPDEVASWASECGYPVVAKPVASAGSDSIFICRDQEELTSAIAALVGNFNVLGRINEDALIQKLMIGEQYVVNTVSCNGQHVVTDVWRSRRIQHGGRSIAYDYAELLPSEGPLQSDLIAYATQVLDALGIRVGAAHTELFLTAEGPVLIETGARMVGSGVPSIVTICAGVGQLELTALAYVDPEIFQFYSKPYTLKKHARLVALISRSVGRLSEDPDLSEIMALPSFHYARFYLKKGDIISLTDDLITSPGDIHLIHEDEAQLEWDLQRVREIEHHLFNVEPVR